MSSLYNVCIFLFIVFFCSCDIINPEESIPTYINIQEINLNTDYNSEGSNSKNISDAWVFIDDEFIGGYQLPATFPVLKEGEHVLKVQAGIKNSGATALRLDYPFYETFEQKVTLTPEQTITITPTVEYFRTLDFEWLEDFDNLSTSLEPSDESVPLEITNDSSLAFEGNGSAKINTTQEAFFYGLSPTLRLPNNGSRVFLEMDYKTEGLMEVRLITKLIGEVDESSIIVLFPKTAWNKIYIDLGSSVSAQPNALSFQVAIVCYNGNEQANATSYIDNIKIIHPG